jgi:hypothetical protein
MKLCLKILAVAVIAAFTYSLTGCASPPSFTYSNVSIALSEICSDCQGGAAAGIYLQYDPTRPGVLLVDGGGNQQGGSIQFTATVSNAPSNLTWTLYPTQNLLQTNPSPTCSTSSTPCSPTELGSGWLTGTFIVQSGNTAWFQNAVIGGVEPIYVGEALAQAETMQYTITYGQPGVTNTGLPTITPESETVTGIPQGSVLLGVSVPNNPDNPSSVTTAYQLMEIYASNPVVYMTPQTPQKPSGLTDSVLSLARSTAATPSTFQFYGGAAGAPPCETSTTCGAQGSTTVGSVDDSVIWEVGSSTATAIAGGNSTYGTITTTGLYTAPLVPPSPQPVVVMASHEQPSVYDYAYITIY